MLSRSLHNRLKRSGSSFRYLIAVLPPALRRSLTVLYLYCRAVDDCADAEDGQNRLQALDQWVNALQTGGHPGDPDLGRAVYDLRRQYDLPMSAFLAIIEGCRQDIEAPLVHPTRKALDAYCDRVAGAVGVLILRLCRCSFAERDDFAMTAGRALQYTNIVRDLAEDAGRGRWYLPPGMTPEDLAAEAESAFARCDHILSLIPRSQRYRMAPARGFIDLYRLLLTALQKRGFSEAAQQQRVRISRLKAFFLLLRTGVQGWSPK